MRKVLLMECEREEEGGRGEKRESDGKFLLGNQDLVGRKKKRKKKKRKRGPAETHGVIISFIYAFNK